MVELTDETLSWENHHGSGRLHVQKMYHLPEQREENTPPFSGAQGLLCFSPEFFYSPRLSGCGHGLTDCPFKLHQTEFARLPLSLSSQTWAATHSICSSCWSSSFIWEGRYCCQTTLIISLLKLRRNFIIAPRLHISHSYCVNVSDWSAAYQL